MNVIEFIFLLLEKFVPVDSMKLRTLQNDGEKWLAGVNEGDTGIALLEKSKKHLDAWYTKTGLAILFIFAVRWLHDFMNPNEQEGVEDDA